MSGQKKTGKNVYRQIEYTYSVYGEDSEYGGSASITIHTGAATYTPQLTLDRSYPTLEEAEDALIMNIQRKIDGIIQ